jgi:hypothetical protein
MLWIINDEEIIDAEDFSPFFSIIVGCNRYI